MVPHLIYNEAFKMDDGSKPDLTVGKEYELNCVFEDEDGVKQYQIVDDCGMVHGFHDDEDWFSEHFTVVGSIDSVMEEI